MIVPLHQPHLSYQQLRKAVQQDRPLTAVSRGIKSDDEALPAAQPEPDGRVIHNDKEAPALPPPLASDRRGSSLLKPERVFKGFDEAQTARPEGFLELCDVAQIAPEPDRFSLFLDIDLRDR